MEATESQLKTIQILQGRWYVHGGGLAQGNTGIHRESIESKELTEFFIEIAKSFELKEIEILNLRDRLSVIAKLAGE